LPNRPHLNVLIQVKYAYMTLTRAKDEVIEVNVEFGGSVGIR